MKTQKNKLMVLIIMFTNNVLAEFLPEKIKFKNITISAEDPIGALWSLFKVVVNYGALLVIVISFLAAGYFVLGALAESRKKGDNSILWSTIMNSAIGIVIVVILALIAREIVA